MNVATEINKEVLTIIAAESIARINCRCRTANAGLTLLPKPSPKLNRIQRLDASAHAKLNEIRLISKDVQFRLFQKRPHRGLFIFYLPSYSPHLNIAETVWRKLKYEWLSASDYQDGQRLRYSVKQILNEFVESLRINFSNFRHSLN